MVTWLAVSIELACAGGIFLCMFFSLEIDFPLGIGASKDCELVNDGEYLMNVLNHLPTSHFNIHCFTCNVHHTSEY